MKTAHPNAGFTLVELAIVMTVIGLLIGGVLKGQEMMRNAQMTATVKRVQSFQAALSTFEDIYKALPGDFIAAQSRLPNCTAANHCYNGNGNYVLGAPIA